MAKFNKNAGKGKGITKEGRNKKSSLHKVKGQATGSKDGKFKKNVDKNKAKSFKKKENSSDSKEIINGEKGKSVIDNTKKVNIYKKNLKSTDRKDGTGVPAKMMKLSAKERKDAKKAKIDHSDEHTQVMAIYAVLRSKKNVPEKKKKVDELLHLVTTSTADEFLYKHDTVRVIEAAIKCGDIVQRQQLFDLASGKFLPLAKSTYGRFLVRKYMEYGTSGQRTNIIKSFHGHIKELMRNKEAAVIVDEIYAKFSNAAQKLALVEEFYGPEFAVFKAASGRTLAEIFADDPAKKATVMKHLQDSFETLCQKEVIVHGIVHRALLEYVLHAVPSQITQLVELLKEKLMHILHTRDGSRVAMHVIWNASVKDRKVIVKSFKTLALKICREEFGHLVMLALFDSVDDTVLVRKALFPELTSSLSELVMDQYGRKVVLYLLEHRAKTFFLPEIIDLLKLGDGNPISKKASDVRHSELREVILAPLLDTMTTNISDVIRNKSASQVLIAAMNLSSSAPEASSNLIESIAGIASQPFDEAIGEMPPDEDQTTPDTEQTGHPVCDECGHLALRRLLRQDKQRVERGEKTLTSAICDAVRAGGFVEWAQSNRGAFVLVSLLESGVTEGEGRVRGEFEGRPLPEEAGDEAQAKGIRLLRGLLEE